MKVSITVKFVRFVSRSIAKVCDMAVNYLYLLDLLKDVCTWPAFQAYISVIGGRIMMRLGRNVGILTVLIVLTFHKDRFSDNILYVFFFFIYLC